MRALAAVLVLLATGCETVSPAPPTRDARVADTPLQVDSGRAVDALDFGDAAIDGSPELDALVDSAFDAGPLPDSLETVLEAALAGSRSPALAAAVVDAEGVRALGAVGVRRFGDETAVTSDDKWHLGSCTKAMTATLIARLVEEGIVTWETRIDDVFPSAAGTPFAAVTLDELSAHYGGFPTQIPSAYWPDIRDEEDLLAQRRRVVTLLIEHPPEGEPGRTYLYSNVGFMVAGAMLEQRTGELWERLLTREVFEPLGMASCGFGPPDADESVAHPWGHRVVDGSVESGNNDNPEALGPAGTVHCSLRDWAKFARAHSTQDERLVPASSYHRMHEPLFDEGYRAGWGLTERSWAQGRTLVHAGSNTWNYAVVWLSPTTGQAYLAAANIDDDDVRLQLDEVISQLVDRYSPR